MVSLVPKIGTDLTQDSGTEHFRYRNDDCPLKPALTFILYFGIHQSNYLFVAGRISENRTGFRYMTNQVYSIAPNVSEVMDGSITRRGETIQRRLSLLKIEDSVGARQLLEQLAAQYVPRTARCR